MLEDTHRGPAQTITVTARGDRLSINPADAPGHSAGLGDTIAKITAATRLDRLAHLYTRVTGKDCGCTRRREALNKMVPYRRRE